MDKTRIAFIADIHHGEDVMTKRSSQALALFSEFAAFVEAERPDIVIDLGDRISDRNRETDLVLEREVAEAFKAIPVPVYHLNGNHDRDFLSVADNEEIIGKPLAHEVVDLGAWQVLVWRADTHIHRLPTGATFRLGEGDLEWLANALDGATKPTVIASHVPLSGQSQRSNYYFDQNHPISIYPELDEIQAVLRQTSVPMACISGHVHWNSVTFIETSEGMPMPSGGDVGVTVAAENRLIASAGAWPHVRGLEMPRPDRFGRVPAEWRAPARAGHARRCGPWVPRFWARPRSGRAAHTASASYNICRSSTARQVRTIPCCARMRRGSPSSS